MMIRNFAANQENLTYLLEKKIKMLFVTFLAAFAPVLGKEKRFCQNLRGTRVFCTKHFVLAKHQEQKVCREKTVAKKICHRRMVR